MVLYEINVRQFSEEGTLAGVDKALPQLKELGVNVLWFMPIYPIGEKNRKGELGSYYSIRDYMAVNPEFGTMDDFKALVAKAHDMGFHVILDWVGNHSAWDNPLATDFPEWYEKDSVGNFVSPFDWTDVIQFDYTAMPLVGLHGWRHEILGCRGGRRRLPLRLPGSGARGVLVQGYHRAQCHQAGAHACRRRGSTPICLSGF